ncbi:MAG: hypothetical protein FWC89_03820 [Defluviitaleaceae bacterium]|nr:hypothetical protein [Defluviitaleaceae bacterium]
MIANLSYIVTCMIDRLASFATLSIAFFVFYLTHCSKHIVVTGKINVMGKIGNSMSFQLKNYAFRDFFISHVYCIYNNGHALLIQRWEDEPLVIKGNGVVRIKMDEYSCLQINDEIKLSGNESHLILHTSDGDVIRVPFLPRRKIRKFKTIKPIIVLRYWYDEILLSSKCAHLLMYTKKNGEDKSLQIFECGHTPETFLAREKSTSVRKRLISVPKDIEKTNEGLWDYFNTAFDVDNLCVIKVPVSAYVEEAKNIEYVQVEYSMLFRHSLHYRGGTTTLLCPQGETLGTFRYEEIG